MDAPTWVAMAVAAALLSCVAYVARVSMQYAQADLYRQEEPKTHTQRVQDAIEQTEAFIGGRTAESHRRRD